MRYSPSIGGFGRESLVHMQWIEVVGCFREVADALFCNRDTLLSGHPDNKLIQNVAAGRMGFDHATGLMAALTPGQQKWIWASAPDWLIGARSGLETAPPATLCGPAFRSMPKRERCSFR